MLPLTRPHRQVLATLALVAFAVAPTGYVALSAWRLNRPGHVRDVEIEAGRALGLQVTLDSVRYPRPGEAVYRGVTLRQEEGPRQSRLSEVARAEVVRLRRDGREWLVEAEGLRLRGDGPRAAVGQLAGLLQRAPGAAIDRVSLASKTCRIDLGDGVGFDLGNVAAEFRLQGDSRAPTLTASYIIPGEAAGIGTRCELSLTRGRGPKGARTSISLQTMDGPPLPARVLDPFFDSGAWLGPGARVAGTLALAQEGAGDWQAEFQGDLREIDLETLVGRRFPNGRLTGRARAAIASARWGERPDGQGPGWVEARGTLTAAQGTIGTGLLRALASEMKFRIAPRADLAKSELEYRGLGLAFALGDDGQITWGGALGGEIGDPKAVLVRGDRVAPLASAPEGTASVRGLWKTLFPTDADVLVPVGAETHVLNYLPLPPTSARGAAALRGN